MKILDPARKNDDMEDILLRSHGEFIYKILGLLASFIIVFSSV